MIDAAIEAGAAFRDGCAVEAILHSGGKVKGIQARRHGARFEDSARITIAADGKHSLIAKLVAGPEYDRIPSLSCVYYSNWPEIEVKGLDVYLRDGYTFLLAPTN